jgi:Short C-terminal domain/SmpA / OmlA family
MKIKIIAIALFTAALFAGCATADKLNDVRIGMSKDQVISLLGKPDSMSAQANIEYLTYYLSNDANYGRDRPYSVRVVDGKVESFGRFMQLFDIYNRPVTGSTQAAMGGMPMPGMPMEGMPMGTAMTTARFSRTTDLAGEIQRLKALKDQGAITDDEFVKAKQKLLGDAK